MLFRRKPDLAANARRLRHHMTPAERRFNRLVKEALPDHTFKCQVVIGRYIVDFCEPDLKLVIEIDGGQHCDNKADIKRDKALRRRGYTVIRFWNNEILTNPEGCLWTLKNAINDLKKF